MKEKNLVYSTSSVAHYVWCVFRNTEGVSSLVLQLSAVTYLLRQLAKAVTQQASLNWIIFWLF